MSACCGIKDLSSTAEGLLRIGVLCAWANISICAISKPQLRAVLDTERAYLRTLWTSFIRKVASDQLVDIDETSQHIESRDDEGYDFSGIPKQVSNVKARQVDRS